MKIKTIKTILEQHGVPYLVQGDRVLADSMEAFTPLFSSVIDVTDYSRDDIYNLLGY